MLESWGRRQLVRVLLFQAARGQDMVVSALLLLAVSVGPRFLDVGFQQLSPFCVMMASRRRVPEGDKCMGRDGKDKIRAKQHRGRMEWEGYHTWLVTQGMLEGDGVPCAVLCVVGFSLLPGCCAAPQGSAFPAARLAAASSQTYMRTRLHGLIPP